MIDIGNWQAPRSVAVIVAHPDDETLWAGGTILNQPSWSWLIISLCRASDQDRAPKFFQVLETYGAEGIMGDLDDSPEQTPLHEKEIQEALLQLLPRKQYNLILTHSPAGEYTRHRRHEEIGKAVITLWHQGKISTDELWLFAYEDGGKKYFPRPIEDANIYWALPEQIWQRKYNLITETYGFQKEGFEAETTSRAEAFWQFKNSTNAWQWLANKVQHESSTAL